MPCPKCGGSSYVSRRNDKFECPHCGFGGRYNTCPDCGTIRVIPRRGPNEILICEVCGFNGKNSLRQYWRASAGELADEMKREGLVSDDPNAVMLRACSVVGGFGHSLPLKVRCGARFDADGVTITSAVGWKSPEGVQGDGTALHLSYADVTDIEISGPGAVKSGRRVWGGGLGLEGAAVGFLAASVISGMTSKTRIQTFLTITAREAQIALLYTQKTPDELRLMLGGPLAKVKAAPPSQEATPDLTVQLERLGELHGKGVLTDEEFAAAKTKLLGDLSHLL